jgi:hypothetical protein
MVKHILLLFLSDIKTYLHEGNVVISKSPYDNLHDSHGDTESTNESAIRYLLQEGWNNEPIEKFDRMFVIVSQKVQTEYIGDRAGHLFTDEQGKHWTHLDYFKHRLDSGQIIRNLKECLTEESICLYDEKQPINQTMTITFDIAAKIQRYVAKVKKQNDQVVLHVDLTGGMRHINMMMLELMRLMEYNQITIGKVLYSNYNMNTHHGKVEEVTQIYQFFNLISGAEEFVRFGSVSTITEYFKNNPQLNQSSVMEDLLHRMKQFSNAIKLSRRKEFMDAANCLCSAINEFKDSKHDAYGDQLMSQMMYRIEIEYEELLSTDWGPIPAIRWCLKHDYLQQALTLYIETIPQYLFDKKIVELTDTGTSEVKEKCKNDPRDECFYALNEYDGNKLEQENVINISKERTAYVKRLKKEIQVAGNSDHMELFEKSMAEKTALQYVFQKYHHTAIATFFELKKYPKKTLAANDPWITHVKEIYRAKNPALLASWEKLPLYEQGKKLVSSIAMNLDELQMRELFGDITQRYSQRPLRLAEMGKIHICIEPVSFGKIMDRYGILKGERNSSNHAKMTQSEFTAEDLKVYMLQGLDEIQELTK